MKLFTRIFIIITMSLSLTINGLLLITQSGFDLLTDLLDDLGVKTPVTMVSKEQKRLKKKNDLLKKTIDSNTNTIEKQKTTIKKQKTAIKKYAKHINNKVNVRAARIASNGAAKTAAAFIPAAANVVLGAAVLMDVVSLAEMCDDMIRFEKSVKDFDDTDLLQETNNITGEVCATKVIEVSEQEAEHYFGNLKKWSDETKQKFDEVLKAISDDTIEQLMTVWDKSVEEWIQLSDRYAVYGVCDLIGERACDVLSKPIKAVCGLTNNKMWGCYSESNFDVIK